MSRYSVVYFSGPEISEMLTPLTHLKQTVKEQERIEKSGKSYPPIPFNPYQHSMTRSRISFEKGQQIQRKEEA